MAKNERWTEHTRSLPPLSMGDHIRVQNQIGNHPTRWDKTGVVIEVRQYHQYVIRVDGSGKVSYYQKLQVFVEIHPYTSTKIYFG